MRKPASWIFFIISRQMTPLVFSRLMRSKIVRRISRKSQSTSRTLRPNSRLDHVVIDAADDDAVQRIGAADLVAVHHVGVGRHLRPQHRQLGRVVLRVAVGVEDQLLGGRSEAGLQRAAVAAVPRMVHDADLRIGARQLVGDLRRRVGAAVVDDDDFEVRASASTPPARRESPCWRWCRCRCRPGRRRSGSELARSRADMEKAVKP